MLKVGVSPFNQSRAYLVLVLCGLAFVVAATAFAYRSTGEYRREKVWLIHTYSVLASLDRLHLALLDAHREKRGYTITADEDVLKPYRAAVSFITATLDELGELVSDNNEQIATLKQLRAEIDSVVPRLDAQIATRRESGFDAGRELSNTIEMEQAIQQSRDLLNEMRVREEQLLKTRSELVDQRSAAMLRAMALAIVLSLLFLAVAAWRTRVELGERIRSEAILREKEERLSLAVAGGGLGTWDFEIPAARFTFNDRWGDMLGFASGELEQGLATWEKRIHPDDRVLALEAMKRHLDGESPNYEVETRLRGKDGNWVWVLSAGRVIERGSEGEPLRICGTHLDITDSRAKADALRAFTEELERSNKELDDFAYIASHDLKEPLRGIRNYANFLLEDYEERLDEDGQSKLRTLTKLADRLETFIEDLLRYSRVGRESFAVKPSDTGKMIQNIGIILGPWLEQQGARLTVATPMPTVPCHPIYVEEVFKNLIGNAVKYNDKPEKIVEVGCNAGGDGEAVFYVRDNGIGVPERHQESIFQIFKRLHGRDKFGGGSGAGLTITRKIVERHGGRIWLDSAVGEGTTFHFTLSNGEQPG